jgi:Arc/MetJ family transcription regulator
MGYLHIEGESMRTNIEIDDQLMRQAMKSSGARTKRATVEAGLRLLVQVRAQAGIRRLRGKIKWEGNLDESRLGRNTE